MKEKKRTYAKSLEEAEGITCQEKKKRKTKQGTEIFYMPEDPPPHTHFKRKMLGSENCVLKLRNNIS